MPPKKRILSSFVMFDVLYADGSRSSNRKVPAMALTGLDGDLPARGVIEDQDREIARASGRPRSPISRVVRSPEKSA